MYTGRLHNAGDVMIINNICKTKAKIITNNTKKLKVTMITNNVEKNKTKIKTNNIEKNKIKKATDIYTENSLEKYMQRILTPKLEASLTVEASLIVPVAIMIFAMVILACIKLYDNSVIEAYSIITRVQYAQYNDYGEDRLKEITENMKKNLDEATISIQLEQFELDTTFLKYNLNIKDNFFTDKTRDILKEDSSEYVRIQHFYKELSNKKEEE